MSYDVDVNGHSFNYTRNMRGFFFDFGAYPPNWAGRDRFEVAAEIDAALVKIRDQEIQDRGLSKMKEKYDSENGWGSVENAITWLEQVAAAMAEPHDDTVEVSW